MAEVAQAAKPVRYAEDGDASADPAQQHSANNQDVGYPPCRQALHLCSFQRELRYTVEQKVRRTVHHIQHELFQCV